MSRTQIRVLGLKFLAVASLMGWQPAAAETLEETMTALAECKTIVDDALRLRCMDNATAEFDRESSRKSVAQFGVRPERTRQNALARAAVDLPAETVERSANGDVLAFTADVSRWSRDERGKTSITLNNGQTWRQADAAELPLSSARLNRVRISAGAMGSFNMTIVGSNRVYKVRRIARDSGEGVLRQ